MRLPGNAIHSDASFSASVSIMPRDGAIIFSDLIGKLTVQAHVKLSSEPYEGDRQLAVRSLGTTASLVLDSPPVLQVLRQDH